MTYKSDSSVYPADMTGPLNAWYASGPGNQKLRDADMATDASFPGPQAVLSLPGVKFYQARGYAVISSQTLANQTKGIPFNIPSPYVNDDSRQEINGLVIPADAVVYHTAAKFLETYNGLELDRPSVLNKVNQVTTTKAIRRVLSVVPTVEKSDQSLDILNPTNKLNHVNFQVNIGDETDDSTALKGKIFILDKGQSSKTPAPWSNDKTNDFNLTIPDGTGLNTATPGFAIVPISTDSAAIGATISSPTIKGIADTLRIKAGDFKFDGTTVFQNSPEFFTSANDLSNGIEYKIVVRDTDTDAVVATQTNSTPNANKAQLATDPILDFYPAGAAAAVGDVDSNVGKYTDKLAIVLLEVNYMVADDVNTVGLDDHAFLKISDKAASGVTTRFDGGSSVY